MENKESAIASAFSSGIIISAVIIVYSLVLYLLDVRDDSYVKYISFLFLAIGLWWSVITYRNKLKGNFISYGGAFSMGFYTGLIVSLIFAIFLFFYVQYINIEIIEKMQLETENEMLENSGVTDEQIEKVLGIIENWGAVILSVVFFFIYLLVSTIFSLIIAILAKRYNQSAILE